MSEVIESINLDHNGHGIKVQTNKQEILISISDDYSCCEQAGFFSSEDDMNSFLGAEVKDVVLVDTALNVGKLKKDSDYDFESKYSEMSIQFVNLETDRGTLQFAVYNIHNGYYGHAIKVKSNQVSLESYL